MIKFIKILIIVIRVSLGLLFVYGGTQKFISKPPSTTAEVSADLPDHVVKIKAFIGGMKQTGYFWQLLGTVEIVSGLLLLSQVLALLGAVILLPVTLNIFLFHLFLEPHEPGELVLTGLYLLANIFLIVRDYPRLKPVFLNLKSI